MPICRHAPANIVGRPSATLSLGHGTGARLKYKARPSSARSALTQLVSKNSSRLAIGATAVAMSVVGRACSAAATSAITAGGIMGSSPCKFTMTSSSLNLRARATSAIRSVPDACCGPVMTHSAPKFAAVSRMRSSSVATMTEAAPLLRAHSQTHWINGRPAMASNGFPGSREAA